MDHEWARRVCSRNGKVRGAVLELDLAIVGDGAAGLTVGMYVARARLTATLFAGLGIEFGEVTRLRRDGGDWLLETHLGDVRADAGIVATGSSLAPLEAPGEQRLVDFLPEEAAGAFCVRGTADHVAEQINRVLDLGSDFEILVPQPMPSPPPDAEGPTYMERIARDVMPRVARAWRAGLASRATRKRAARGTPPAVRLRPTTRSPARARRPSAPARVAARPTSARRRRPPSRRRRGR